MTIVYIGLGSNLDNPVQQLNDAVAALVKIPQTQLLGLSSFYQTVPVGYKNQPDFTNAVAKLTTELSPDELLDFLKKIELAQKRVRSIEKNGPRTIDLDILLFEDLQYDNENLTIPHPRMLERAFVIIPLYEIASDLILPNGVPLQSYYQKMTNKDMLCHRL